MGQGGTNDLLIGLFLIGIIVVLVITSRRRAEQEQRSLEVGVSPEEAIDVVTTHMVRNGFAIAYRGDTSVTFTRPKRANADIGCLLLLLGIIPGLLYFGLFKGTQTTTVIATHNQGRTELALSGDDRDARRDLAVWIRAAAS
jgi:hypothetical protein